MLHRALADKTNDQKTWVDRKVAHMIRTGIPAEINPVTGAARPKDKAAADKAAEENRRVRRPPGMPDIEFGGSYAGFRRPRRPLTDRERFRQFVALGRAKDAARRAAEEKPASLVPVPSPKESVRPKRARASKSTKSPRRRATTKKARAT